VMFSTPIKLPAATSANENATLTSTVIQSAV
jgi:hypothetical protein